LDQTPEPRPEAAGPKGRTKTAYVLAALGVAVLVGLAWMARRHPPAPAGRVAAASQAQAESPETETARATPPPSPAFAQFPVQVSAGPFKRPDFTGSGKFAADFRSVIGRRLVAGVNFAGHFNIVEASCGAGCHVIIPIDLATGRVLSFPLGGENDMDLALDYRPDSDLIKAAWEGDVAGAATCHFETLRFVGGVFKALDRKDVRGECPQA
jgi:hypothetical protein